MTNRNTKLTVFALVLAALLLIGGVVYLTFTAVNANKYQSVVATVKEIEKQVNDDESVTVTAIIVQYTTDNGTVESKLVGRLPAEFTEGGTLTVRYEKSNPLNVTAERVDWATPTILLIIGVLYAVGSVLFIFLRKKAGDYAIYDGTVEGDGIFDDEEPELSTETVAESTASMENDQ